MFCPTSVPSSFWRTNPGGSLFFLIPPGRFDNTTKLKCQFTQKIQLLLATKMTTDASNDIIKPTRTSSRDVNNGTKMTTHATNYNKPNPSTRSIVNDAYHAVDDFVDSVDDYVDKEIEEAKQASRALRRRWVPVVKSTLASLADVIGERMEVCFLMSFLLKCLFEEDRFA
jgi:hypothetical protein